MQHEVFISHSSVDKTIADAICHTLEQHGMACWIAPRDVRVGYPYASEIMNGIKACKVMVLVFSRNANMSRHVRNEIDHAFNAGKTIIPFITDNTEMGAELDYYLSRNHWLVAYPDYEKRFGDLVTAVANALGRQHMSTGKTDLAAPGTDKPMAGDSQKPGKPLGKIDLSAFVEPDNDFDYEEGMAFIEAGETEEAMLPLLRSALSGNKKAQRTIENILVEQSRKLCDRCDEFWHLAEDEADYDNTFAMLCRFFYLDATGQQNDEAFDLIKKVVNTSPSPTAYLMLGICYEWGQGTKKNTKLALHYYNKAIEGGCRQAYSHMGQVYEYGEETIAKDTDKAVELYRKGMELGDKRSSRRLFGYCLWTLNDSDAALKVADHMERHGISGSLTARGEVCDYEGQRDEACKYYTQALEKGETGMFVNLACYYYDLGHNDEARQMAQRGMAEGDSRATYFCGYLAEEDGDNARAWHCYQTRYMRFGVSADDLGRLYMETGYKPDDFDLDTLMGWLGLQARVCASKEACTVYAQLASYRKFDDKTLRFDLLCQLPETHDIIKLGCSYGLSNMTYLYGRLLCSRQYRLPNPIEGKRLIDKAANENEPLAVEWLIKEAATDNDQDRLKAWCEFAADNNVFVSEDHPYHEDFNALDAVLHNVADNDKLAAYTRAYMDKLANENGENYTLFAAVLEMRRAGRSEFGDDDVRYISHKASKPQHDDGVLMPNAGQVRKLRNCIEDLTIETDDPDKPSLPYSNSMVANGEKCEWQQEKFFYATHTFRNFDQCVNNYYIETLFAPLREDGSFDRVRKSGDASLGCAAELYKANYEFNRQYRAICQHYPDLITYVDDHMPTTFGDFVPMILPSTLQSMAIKTMRRFLSAHKLYGQCKWNKIVANMHDVNKILDDKLYHEIFDSSEDMSDTLAFITSDRTPEEMTMLEDRTEFYICFAELMTELALMCDLHHEIEQAADNHDTAKLAEILNARVKAIEAKGIAHSLPHFDESNLPQIKNVIYPK